MAPRTVAAQQPGSRVDAGLVRLALALFGVILLLMSAGVGLHVAASNRPGADDVVFLVSVAATPVLGVLLTGRRPTNPIGWLFLAAGAATAYGLFCDAYGRYGLVAHPGSLPLADWVLWSGAVTLAAFYLPAIFVLLLFPDGSLPSRRWRIVFGAAVAAMAAQLAGTMLGPDLIQDFDGADIANPGQIGSLDDVLTGMGDAAGAVAGLCGLAAAVSLVIRYRSAGPGQRRQLEFFGATVLVLVAFGVAGNTIGGGYGNNEVITLVNDLLLLLGLPASLAAAVLWRGLYDIERLVNRKVVMSLLGTLIVAGCAAAAWGIGYAAAGHVPVGVAVLCTVVVTMLVEPVRRLLHRSAGRFVLGRSPRGYELATDFGATVDRTGDVGELTGRLAELVCRGLDTRWARAILHTETLDETVAECTAPRVRAVDGEPVVSVPIRHRNAQLGVVECGAKLEGEFTEHDRRLLELLAKECALAAHGIDLAASLARQVQTVRRQAAELDASRSRIVAAQEAERRRIERNIHDGAQQELVALIAKVRLARDLLDRDVAGARSALEEIRGDVRSVLRDIRELAQGIHPTVLADQGLVRAVEDRATRLPLDVEIRADSTTRTARYDDAIEGAAYFVVSEALANVLKHAEASRAAVGLAQRNGTLDITVRDDGRGLRPGSGRGTGLVALSDRIEALGGRFDVSSVPGGGTTVHAEIPTRSGSP